MSNLLLRPEFITSSSLYMTLKSGGFFQGKGLIYVISPADLEFAHVDKALKNRAFNSLAPDLMSKVATIPSNATVIIDGVMIHHKLGVKGLYIDTFGLDTKLVSQFKEVRRLGINSVPEILYKTILTETPEQDLDNNLSIWDEYRHVIFGGRSLESMTIDAYKASITTFNDKGKGSIYVTKMLPRNVNNCDYLHVITPMTKWDFEYLTTMLYRSTYTSKDLKVVFYVREQDKEQYNVLADHLNEHLSFEDANVLVVPLALHMGILKW